MFDLGDNIDIVARTPVTLMQTFVSLESEADRIHLRLNQEDTKYVSCFETQFISSLLRNRKLKVRNY